jgi:phage shock protein C
MKQIEYEPANERSSHRLGLRRTGSMIAGVCSGLAYFLDVDVRLVRLATVALTITSGWTIAAYIAAAFIMPSDESNEDVELKPFFEGQKLVQQVKRIGSQLLRAIAMKDQPAFRRYWQELIETMRDAWVDTLKAHRAGRDA